MRLDKKLAEKQISRSKAADLIRDERVLVNGKVVTKPSFDVQEQDEIEILEALDFVSRAGHKLEGAFQAFSFSVEDQTVLDIGASTGGFTQCCLNHGAAKVYALDVGHLQLADSLKQDERVVEMEGRNARGLKKDWFEDEINFLCMDVSFISSELILEPVFQEIEPEHLVLLVKPQFELDPSRLNKNGIVKNEKDRLKAIDKVNNFINKYYKQVSVIDSPIKGRGGNQEALIYARERRGND